MGADVLRGESSPHARRNGATGHQQPGTVFLARGMAMSDRLWCRVERRTVQTGSEQLGGFYGVAFLEYNIVGAFECQSVEGLPRRHGDCEIADGRAAGNRACSTGRRNDARRTVGSR